MTSKKGLNLSQAMKHEHSLPGGINDENNVEVQIETLLDE